MPLWQHSKAEVAWAAGLFEGEGCITFNGKWPSLQMNFTDIDVLSHFHSVVEYGAIYGPYHLPSRKPVWKWSVSGIEKSQTILATFWPWLGVRRKARATEVLTTSKQTNVNNQYKTNCNRGHLLSGSNVIQNQSSPGHRACRTCKHMTDNARTQRRRANVTTI